jgi:hypothetical protein
MAALMVVYQEDTQNLYERLCEDNLCLDHAYNDMPPSIAVWHSVLH